VTLKTGVMMLNIHRNILHFTVYSHRKDIRIIFHNLYRISSNKRSRGDFIQIHKQSLIIPNYCIKVHFKCLCMIEF